MAARGETQANVEVSTLVVPAWMLRWRAPELALVLGERAVALAATRRDEADRLRAEALVVFAGNRVGRGVRFADRAIDALKAAEAAGEHETGWLLRVELAACARSVGAPLTGFAAVLPVLEAPDVPAELRASALVQASECLVTVGRGDEPTQALAEADQLYVADTSLDEDTRLLLRGLIRAVQAAQHRRWGDLAAAIGAAREGLDLLSRFSDPDADSGQGVGRLTLELALSLMDANRLLDASEIGAPMLDVPVRAPSASTTGWLRLALATRVHLPAGRVALAREMLREAAASAERHQLDTLLAESLLALAHVHEVSGELADALTNLRSAHAAERRRARAVYAVRARLAAEFSGVHRQPADLHQQLASLLRPIEGMQVVTDGVLSAALKQQLRQWRPVQVRKGDGLKVKRVRRAAEDMTVEGLSAARQHAADRWRMVQPFGEPDDKTPEAVEPPPAPLPQSSSPHPSPTSPSDRTVPASGLIASAGAMVSGRRRAARVASGEIDDRPTTIAEIPITPALPDPDPAPRPDQPPLSVEQERKRKVEQQLMELQREARRQIEAERAERLAQAEREAQAAEEAARQEAALKEAARQEAAREEAARQEAARQEAAREEAVRQEAARQEAARQEAAREEAARQEAARQEAARQEAARQEIARQEAVAREEAARQEAARQEESRREAARQEAVRRDVARQEAAHQEVARQAVEREDAAREAAAREEAARAKSATHTEESNSQSESVLDMLKAQGLRAGGRRRARAAEPGATTPSWRVEPPSGPRQDTSATDASSNYFADSGISSRANRFSDSSSSSRPNLRGDAETSARPDPFGDAEPSVRPDHPGGLTSSAGHDHPGGTASSARPDDLGDPASAGRPDYLDEQATPARPDSTASSAGLDHLGDSTSSARPDYLGDQASSARPDYFSESTSSARRDSFGDSTSPGHSDYSGDSARPDYFGDQGASDGPGRSGLAAAFSRLPASPDFGPHLDEPGYPLHTPADGFPALSYDPDERRLPDLDFSGLDFSTPKPVVSVPAPPAPAEEAEREPLSAVPEPISSVPPEPDLLSTSFLSSADVDDDPGDVPTTPVRVQSQPEQTQPAFDTQTSFGTQSAFGGQGAADAPTEKGFSAVGPDNSGEPADRTGRPSSRRRPSEMSLADLLAEALVAYETGRRSDEEQVEAADLAASDFSAGEAAPDSGVTDRPAESGAGFDVAAEVRGGSEDRFQPGPSFGSPLDPAAGTAFSSDALFRSSRSYGGPEDDSVSAEEMFGSGESFIVQLNPPAESRPSFEVESAQERTGPIARVSDSETTGPIRRFRDGGPPGWTLPGV